MLKLCIQCDQIKNLSTEYYKAGVYHQKYCKACHNSNRLQYASSPKPYIKKMTGFKKMPIILQKKILNDINAGGLSFSSIYNKHKDELVHGKHPTQKPERLIDRMIKISSKKNDLMLCPFSGSGTECVVAFKNKMKLSDYVAQKVHELGIKHVFMVTGGGSMHLNHSLGTHVKLECIFNHHEQSERWLY